MTPDKDSIILTIDPKKNRLRLFKSTVRMLGNPKLVRLLINPDKDILMICAAKDMTPGGQELYLHLSKTGSDSSYDIYSLPFVRKLQNDYSELRGRCIYRLYGSFSEESKAVLFPIGTLERVSADEGRNEDI